MRPSASATIIYGFGCDVEVIWQHRFTNRLVTDLGLSAIYAGSHSNLGDWWPVPIATLVFAIQF